MDERRAVDKVLFRIELYGAICAVVCDLLLLYLLAPYGQVVLNRLLA